MTQRPAAGLKVRRRGILLAGLAAAGASMLGSRLVPAGEDDAAAGAPVVSSLGDGLSLVSGAGGNVVVLESPDALLMVDGGSRERSAALLAAVERLGAGKPVRTLFNTHWHWDQTGSNAALIARGARVISHENTRLWLGTEVDSRWENRVYPRLPKEARPTETFYTTGSLEFGGEQVDYGHLPQAHTDGDTYVFFRKANVLVAGDLVSVGGYPVIDYCTGGWVGGLANAAKALVDLGNDATRYVPGRGTPQARAQVRAEAEMLATMRQRLAKLLADGMSVEDMIEAKPTKDFDAAWGDPRLFIANAWPGLVYRARELGVSIV
jgi:glyoxylase-like metal-dependent hydrolase (beta-lactamase superfamily II)